MSTITNIAKKRLARRERLNPDWPIKVQSYDCWPQHKPPKELWDTAHDMRRLWNDFAAIFTEILAKDLKDEAGAPLLSKEERNTLWAPLNTKELREVGKGYKEKLDQGCREFVINHFQTTVNNWRKNPSLFGPPKQQKAGQMDKINIPLVFSAGHSADWLTGGGGTVGVRDTRELKRSAPDEYLNNGYFCVGINRARLDLHVAYGGRSGQKKYHLPEGCRVKAASLCGRKDTAFGWSWTLQVRLEHPPAPARVSTGRVCGWDSGGWRRIDDRIRIGVIADNAGHFYEISVPWQPALSHRSKREMDYCERQGWQYSKPLSWDDLMELDSKYGKALQACKDQVRKIHEEEKQSWPENAKHIISGIVKMREGGLRNLRAALDETNSAAKRMIDDWSAEAEQLNRTIRAFEIHAMNAKEDAFRQVAAWMNAFDVIAWGADLSQKQMAEQAGKRKQERKEKFEETGEWEHRTPDERILEASQKFRQIAGQYQLRLFVKEKHANRLQNEKTAYSSRTCQECGADIKPGRNLLLVCETGHRRDQDVTASLNFLNRIEGQASIAAPPVEIPEHLRRYLRVMDASEVQLTVADESD